MPVSTNVGTTCIQTGIGPKLEKTTFTGFATSFNFWNNTNSVVKIEIETAQGVKGFQTIPPCYMLEMSISSDAFACVTAQGETVDAEGQWFVNWFKDNNSESCGQSGNPDYTKLTAIPKGGGVTNIDEPITFVQPEKCYINTIQVAKPDNPKERIWVDVYKDSTTGMPCFFPVGTTDLINTNQLTFNTDFIMNENRMGQLIVGSNLIPNEFPFPSDGLVICHDATDQDIVALIKTNPLYTAFITDLTAKFPLPEGATYDLSKISVEQVNGIPKRTVHCDFTDADAVISSNAQISSTILGNESDLTVGGYKKLSKPQKEIDLIVDGKCVTCTDESCKAADGDIILNGEEKTASQVDFCVRCYAPDPNAEGGEK